MWKFKFAAEKLKAALKNRKPKTGPKEDHKSPLTESSLQAKTFRQLKMIAAASLLLILADLAISIGSPGPDIYQESGRLYLLRPAAGQAPSHISLDATVNSEGEVYRQRFDIRLDPQRPASEEANRDTAAEAPASPRSAEEVIRGELRSISSGWNEDLTRRRVFLPEHLSGGEEILWSRRGSSNTALLTGMTFFIMLLIYRNRFRPLKKQAELDTRSVQRHLPAFINELVLLLNAGMVLTSAFETAADKYASDESGDYFSRGMRRICHSVRHTNGVMNEELQAFAKESGVSEFMRVSRIITDNINKGADLCRKLERESEALWHGRKLKAEEEGRLAETRMTLPLSIFLCVLIIITVSPAMLQL